jgi:hypothetical protein
MKVVFKTNLDRYKTNCFPNNFEIPPRIGESVLVLESFADYFIKQKLPIRLEVVDVFWTENGAVCELWYKKIDVEACKLSGVDLF